MTRRKTGRPKGSKTRPRRIEDYQALGDAPADELEATRWAFRANAVALREVMADLRMKPERRRAEIRTISRTMNALLPKARLRAAEDLIRGEEAKIEAKVDPQIEDAPPAPAPKRAPKPRPAAPSAELEPVPPAKGDE